MDAKVRDAFTIRCRECKEVAIDKLWDCIMCSGLRELEEAAVFPLLKNLFDILRRHTTLKFILEVPTCKSSTEAVWIGDSLK